MDNVFGSPKINRKLLRPNRRDGIVQHFDYVPSNKFKSAAEPKVFTYLTRGKGVQGETVNSTNNAARLIVNRNRKPLQS
jgi:hypothetical protein